MLAATPRQREVQLESMVGKLVHMDRATFTILQFLTVLGRAVPKLDVREIRMMMHNAV